MFLVVKMSFFFGPRSSAECRIVSTVTECALIEVGRYLFVFVFALLVLDNQSMIIAVGLSLILMLMRVPQKLELVEDEIRYCATCQSQLRTNTLVDLTPVFTTSHLRRCAAMFEQSSGVVRFQLFKKSEMSISKHDQATHRQSAVRCLVLESESLNEALCALTIATTVRPGTLAFRFSLASVLALLALPYILLLGLVSIGLRLAPCTSLVGLLVRHLDVTIRAMILGAPATISACRMRLCNTHVHGSDAGILRPIVRLASTLHPLL